MGIYQKLKFFIGKVTVLIMAVIFPFAVIVQNRKVSSFFVMFYSDGAAGITVCGY